MNNEILEKHGGAMKRQLIMNGSTKGKCKEYIDILRDKGYWVKKFVMV